MHQKGIQSWSVINSGKKKINNEDYILIISRRHEHRHEPEKASKTKYELLIILGKTCNSCVHHNKNVMG